MSSLLVLPYVEIREKWTHGHLRFSPATSRATASLSVRYCDGKGRPVRKPTLIGASSKDQPSVARVEQEVDETLQILMYVLFDHSIRPRRRPLARWKRLPGLPWTDELAWIRGIRDTNMEFLDPQVFATFHVTDDANTQDPVSVYAPSHVSPLRVNLGALAADGLARAIFACSSVTRLKFVPAAIRWFNRSMARFPHLGTTEQLLFRSIAFEVLLRLPKVRDKQLVLAYALKNWIPDVAEDKLTAWASSFYKKRNEIVHAGALPSPAIQHSYGSDLLMSQMVFHACLRACLSMLGLYHYARRDRRAISLRLDGWLLSNKERCERLGKFNLDQLRRNPDSSEEFLRLCDSLHLGDLNVDDELIRATMKALLRVAKDLIEAIELTWDLTSDEKAAVQKWSSSLKALSLDGRPSGYDTSTLDFPGYGRAFLGSGKDYTYYDEGARRQEIRQRIKREWADLATGGSPAEMRQWAEERPFAHRWMWLVPLPEVSLKDVACALHELYELRRAVYDRELQEEIMTNWEMSDEIDL